MANIKSLPEQPSKKQQKMGPNGMMVDEPGSYAGALQGKDPPTEEELRIAREQAEIAEKELAAQREREAEAHQKQLAEAQQLSLQEAENARVAEAQAQELFTISLDQAEEAGARADRLPLPRNWDAVLDASKALRKASCTPRGGGIAALPLLCTTGLAASVALHAPAASAFSSRKARGLSLAGRIGAKVQGKRLFSAEFAQNVVPASASD